MEEMSKKTKRLEKENLTLTRKHEATNQNILKMAEERTRTHKELELLRKKNENLEKLCRGMQAQGRGTVPNLPEGEDGEGTESEYEDEDYEDESGEYDDDDDDTEDEHERLEAAAVNTTAGARRAYGPVPPPPTTAPPAIANGAVNGNGRKGSQHLPGQQFNGIRA
jgi:hypothetical protein